MASLSIHQTDDFAVTERRSDLAGLAMSAVLPLAAVMVLNGMAIATGTMLPELGTRLPNWMPGWAAALGFLVIYPMWGIAHWLVAREGEKGRVASRWLLGLITAGLAYPFVIGALDPFMAVWANVGMVLLVVAAIANAGRAAPRAVYWIAPSLFFMGGLALSGFAAIAAGWSPGFFTNQNQAAL
ncbi:tryptophan-rich sensory protein [Arsenicitalea aurantiaca]|nr:tryptophan-rich sensory protein [Arsenicitalea aurantiaca]